MPISAQKFKELKVAVKNAASLQTAANRNHVSMSTMRRVKKAKSYADFKAILVKDRGPNYGVKYVFTPKPKMGTVSTTTKVTTAQETPKRKWWEKLLNI